MSTDDVTQSARPCQCGRGKVIVTATAPDHPWVRDSQTQYTALIECDECAKNYIVEHHDSGKRPTLLLRIQVEAMQAARHDFNMAAREIAQTKEFQDLKEHLISRIEELPSWAAQHRKLNDLRLIYESLDMYRKNIKRNPDHVRKIVEGSSVPALTKIGSELAKKTDFYAIAHQRLKELEGAVDAARPAPIPI